MEPGAGWTPYVDAVGSFVLAAFMLWSAYSLVSSSVPDLIDCAVEQSLQVRIGESLSGHRGQFQELVRIRSRRTGSRILVELLVAFDPGEAFGGVHRVAQEISATVQRQLPGSEVTVVPWVQ